MSQPKIELLAFGEFLLRLHSENSRRFLQAGGYQPYYAGAEANVCVLLSRLGVKTSYISRVPEHDIAKAGIEQLRGSGVFVEDMVYGGDKLGLYFTEQGNHIRSTKVVYDRAFSSYSYLEPGMIDWERVMKDVPIYHWTGIAAAVSQSSADVCAEAIEVARRKGVRISCDFNYRATLWKYGKKAAEVMPALLAASEIAVADLDSASIYFGIETDKEASFEERFKQCSQALKAKLPNLKTLVMSYRSTKGIEHQYYGAIMHHDKFAFSPVYSLSYVTDQIGSGDSFTGGMLYGIINQFEPQKIIDFATSCGALKQSIPGDFALINKQEVEAFMQYGSTSRIIR